MDSETEEKFALIGDKLSSISMSEDDVAALITHGRCSGLQPNHYCHSRGREII